ncbi:hypothetical protein QTP86_007992 [Hemibagrus guttatus]|nr:hypothetical protein QTP86_007992 [Hemibagrus guttatus]
MVDYGQNMQARIDQVGPIVREHMEAAQRDQERTYNQPAQLWEFHPGDQVIHLVPNTACTFLAKWQGPYTFLEQPSRLCLRLLLQSPKPPSPPLGAIGSNESCPLASMGPSYIPTPHVLIQSSTWLDQLFHLREVLSGLRKAGLTANPCKCHLGLTEAQYLGYCIGHGLLQPQEKKVEAIRDYPKPTTKQQHKPPPLQVFLHLLPLQITMSSANIIVQGDSCLTSPDNWSITIANRKGLRANP